MMVTKGGDSMALINCPECNKEISDKAVACPNCGCPQSEFIQQPEDTRSEIDKIADEIFWNAPDYVEMCAKELVKRTGIQRKQAREIFREKHLQWKSDKKNGKYPDTQYCPRCASQDIGSYEEPGIITMGKHNAFGGGYIGMQAKSTIWMRCNSCRYQWRPKRK